MRTKQHQKSDVSRGEEVQGGPASTKPYGITEIDFVAVPVVAVLLAGAHVIWPNAKIDAITLGLLTFAVLPWLRGVLKGLKLPGGLEITLADAEKAAEKIVPQTRIVSLAASGEEPNPADWTLPPRFQADPNLALVALRIELESRIRALASKRGLDAGKKSLRRVVDQLSYAEMLTTYTADGIDTLLQYGNAAAHGAKVDKSVAYWAPSKGSEILAALDALLDK